MVGMKSVFLLIVVVSAVHTFPYGDSCDLSISPQPSSFSDPDKPFAHYNLTCSSGQIYWNFPEGRIRLWFPSTACLVQGAGASWITVYEHTDDTERELIFYEGRACVRSSDGFSLILEGPRERTYIALYSYHIPSTDTTFRDRFRGVLNHFTAEVSRSFHNLLQSWRIRLRTK